MNRLAILIETLPLAELLLLQKDVQAGNLARLIEQRIQKLTATKQCPTCGRELEARDQKFSLEFGPGDLRQKAYFDEYDCLHYFMEKLRAKSTPEAD